MQTKELLIGYLELLKIMQLATSDNGQPWVCNLHYYSDKDLNLYWISKQETRHSQEIMKTPKVASVILVHEDTLQEQYVIGISIEGTAEPFDIKSNEEVGRGYIQKIGGDQSLLDDILRGKNPHKFYRLKPAKIVLFDSKNFPHDPRQELTVT